MLDAEQTIRLLDAGYTKEQIEAMGTGKQEQTDEQDNDAGGNDAGTEKPKENNPENTGAVTKDDLDPFRAEIDELKKTIKALQAQNTKSDSFTPPNETKTIIEDLSKNF